jgi:hypothetical protein
MRETKEALVKAVREERRDHLVRPVNKARAVTAHHLVCRPVIKSEFSIRDYNTKRRLCIQSFSINSTRISKIHMYLTSSVT